MSLSKLIKESFERSFGLYCDLIDAIDESILSSKLQQLPSNTVGLQLWCVVGARKSFSQAIIENAWSGFSCSLQSSISKTNVSDALQRSATTVAETLKSIENFSDVQNRFIIDLLEYEAAHHGQLIRDIYGLDLPIPESWKAKYALQEIS